MYADVPAVKSAIAQVEHAGNKCGDIIHGLENKLHLTQQEVNRANQQLKGARVELQKSREEAFAKVLGNDAGGRLPRYVEGGRAQREWQAPSGPPLGYTG
jgi:hypothetical protein